MPKYIDADAFEDSARMRYCDPCRKDGKDYHGLGCRACWVDDMLGEIIDAPSAEVRRWISMDEQTPEEGKRVDPGVECRLRSSVAFGTALNSGRKSRRSSGRSGGCRCRMRKGRNDEKG